MKYDTKKINNPNIKTIYKKIDGIELPAWIYLPKVKNANPKTIICIHGGGWTAGMDKNNTFDGEHMKYQADYYAKQGNIGIVISYRSLNTGATLSDIVADCADAVNYLTQNYSFINKNNVVLMGDSAGAQLCFSIVQNGSLSIMPKAVILCNPVADLNRERWHYVESNPLKRTEFSPVDSVSKLIPDISFILLHGTKDTVAAIEDTKKLHTLLSENGFHAEFIELEDATHAFILFNYKTTTDKVLDYMSIIDIFLKKIDFKQ